MVAQPVGTLSGGEKARLVLAMLVWQRPNLLLLDEPTNHLDLTTREALSMALNEFEGTVMLVSHDRALLREVCDEFWLVDRRRASSRSTATSTTTSAGCSNSRSAAARERSAGERRAQAPRGGGGEAEAPPMRPSRAHRRLPHDAGARAAEAPRGAQGRGPGAPAARRRGQAAAQGAEPRRQPARRPVRRARRARGQRWPSPTSTPAKLAEAGKRLKAIGEQIEPLEARWLELSTQLDEIAESVG